MPSPARTGRGRGGESPAAETPGHRFAEGLHEEESSASSIYPPLGKRQLEQLLERFSSRSTWLPSSVKQLKAEDVRIKWTSHLEASKLLKTRECVASRGRAGCSDDSSMIVVQRPAHDHVKFFVNPKDLGVVPIADLELYGVPKELRPQMLAKHYVEIYPKMLSGDSHVRALPECVGRTTAAADVEAVPTGSEPSPPVELKMPNTMPPWKGSMAAAPLLIQWFERVVVEVMPNNSTIAYSPMRLWCSPELRKQHRIDPTKFSQYCKAYVYLKTKADGVAVDAMTDSLSTIKSSSNAHLSKDGRSDWFERGLKCYTESHP